MTNLRKYTISEFAEVINEEVEVIRDLTRNNKYLGYTNNPYYHITMAVEKSTINNNNKEIVAKYIYANLYNVHSPRFHDKTRGWGPTIYSTIGDCPNH